MGAKQGNVGIANNFTFFKTPVSIGLTMSENEKPCGTITFDNIVQGGARWSNRNWSNQCKVDLYLCDSQGNNAVLLFNLTINGNSTLYTKTATVDAPGLKGKALYIKAVNRNSAAEPDGRDYIALQNNTTVTVNTQIVDNPITTLVTPENCGTLTASKERAAQGETITLLPTPASGYKFVKYTISPNITITGNTFTMPAQAVTVTAVFERIVYAVTCKASPSNGGTLTADRAAAGPGDTVTLTPKPASGYYLTGYTSTPSVTVTDNKFTMPGQGITIQANFAKITYNITCIVSPANCGTLKASPNSAAAGDEVTLLPTPASGYKFVKYTVSPNITISGNKFTMPAQVVTVTAVFERIVYAVTCKASPSTGGTLKADRATAGPGDTVTLTPTPKSGYYLTGYTSTPSVTITNNTFTMPGQAITIQANFAMITYGITCQVTPAGAGTLKANKTSAAPGDAITLTASPGTGWKLKKYTSSPSVSFSGNKFTMPGQAITVTAEFEKLAYTITGASSPQGAGSVILSANAANMGDEITFSQTPNTGYYFNGWTFNPTLTPSGNKFTMPANNVVVTANYLKRSTADLSSKSVTGAGTVTLNITADKTAYSHKYRLSFGTGMETSLTNVAAGVKSVAIQIPENWSNQIPNSASKTGGTLLLETYSGTTKIGEYTITGLTFNVPAGYAPSISDITTDIIRTIGGKTYANIGEIYTQKHCGTRIQATGTGNHGSTIANMTVAVGGYTGGNYNKTFAAAAVDFTTGLLTIAGTTVITVTATDSRGRTTSKTKTISVTEYNAPAGSLSAWRCDVNGDTDPMGIYGKYEITKRYSEIGTNSLTVMLESQGTTATISADTGDIMPGSRKVFSIQQEYQIKLTLQDAFEKTEIKVTLQSAKFILYVNADGTKLGLMKATTKSIPAGKNATIELSGDAQIYIGDETIEEFITRIAGS